MNNPAVEIKNIRYPGEALAFGLLFTAALVTSLILIAWGAALYLQDPAVLMAVILVYVVPIFLITWLAKVLAMAGIRGNGIRVSEEQYPELHAYTQDFAARLGMAKVPEVYVVQATMMNAFATKVIRRRYVVLFSHLVDAALESGDHDEVAMIMGHEMAHHAAGHVRWMGFLRLGAWTPFLYNYWSRKAEYTCDRAGMLLVDKLQPSLQGIIKLAVGRKLAARTNMTALRKQKEAVSGELGPTFVEIFSTHPLTVKRLIQMEDFAQMRQLS